MSPNLKDPTILSINQNNLKGFTNKKNECYVISVLQTLLYDATIFSLFLSPPNVVVKPSEVTQVCNGKSFILKKSQTDINNEEMRIQAYKKNLQHIAEELTNTKTKSLSCTDFRLSTMFSDYINNDQQDAALFFNFICSTFPPLAELFSFKINLISECLNAECFTMEKHYSHTIVDSNSMLIIIDPNEQQIDLENKIKEQQFRNGKFATQDSHCAGCNKTLFETEYYFDIASDFIALHLKIFYTVTDPHTKESYTLKNENVFIDDFDAIISINNSNYEIIGGVFHLGLSISGGHYISYVKKKSKWYKMDDDRIQMQSVPKKMVKPSDGTLYIVMLKKIVRELLVINE